MISFDIVDFTSDNGYTIYQVNKDYESCGKPES